MNLHINFGVTSSEEELYKDASVQVKDAYLRMKNPSEYELYDFKNDPNELVNLADEGAYSGVLTELKNELRKWQDEISDALADTIKARRLFDMIRDAGTEGPRQLIPYFEIMNPAKSPGLK